MLMKTGNIKCPKCSGKIVVDRIFTKWNTLEIFCMNCGYRKLWDKADEKGGVVAWLMKNERELSIAKTGYLLRASKHGFTKANS